MKRLIPFLITITLLMICPVLAQETGNAQEIAAIKKVVETAYVQGIHIERDLEKIKSGFHPDFSMLMLRNGQMSKMTIQAWMDRIEQGKKRNPNPPKVEVKHKFSMVNVEGNAATLRIEIYKDGKHKYSDYMALYKFADGWKIVNKIYFTQPQ